MNKLVTFICLTSSVFGHYVPDIQTRNTPAPLSFDFTVENTYGDLSAREFWAQENAKKAKRDGFAEVINNVQDIYYMMNIYLGSNKQKNYVVIDTGSSDLWVPSSGYSQNTSSTSQDTGKFFGIRYIDGSLSQGKYYRDSLHFEGSSSALSNFQFAVSSNGGPGVLGLGNKALEVARDKYDNLPWALQKSGITPKASYSMYLGRETGSGVVIFGGIDTEKYEGCLTKYPVLTNARDFDLNVLSISFGGNQVPINSAYTLDTGTSLCYVGADLLSVIDVAFNTTVVDEGGVFYRMVDCTQPTDQHMVFDFGLNKISISYADLVLHNDDGTCLLGLAYANGNQLLGGPFLRSAYVYFDLTDQTISLAQAQYSDASKIITA